MNVIQTWWLAIRPKTLWAGIAPVMIGTALAFRDGGFHAPSAIAALLGAMLIQIGTNLCNDYSDFKKGADTEDRQGPIRVTQAGLIKPATVLSATFFIFALAMIACGYLVFRAGWPLVAIGVLSIISGILYTAGPYPIGYLGLGDIFVLIFFGPIAVGGTYFVQTLDIHPAILVSGLAPGLLAVAILVVNNLRDRDQDVLAGKKTLAVRFGRSFVRAEYVLCILGTILLCVWHSRESMNDWYFGLGAVLMIPGFFLIRTVYRYADGKHLNPVLGKTALLLLLYSVGFSLITIFWSN